MFCPPFSSASSKTNIFLLIYLLWTLRNWTLCLQPTCNMNMLVYSSSKCFPNSFLKHKYFYTMQHVCTEEIHLSVFLKVFLSTNIYILCNMYTCTEETLLSVSPKVFWSTNIYILCNMYVLRKRIRVFPHVFWSIKICILQNMYVQRKHIFVFSPKFQA